MKKNDINYLKNLCLKAYGMTYLEFDELTCEEQDILKIKYIKSKSKKKYIILLRGSNEKLTIVEKLELLFTIDNTQKIFKEMFKKVKVGKIITLSDGTKVIAGETPWESREKIDKQIEGIIEKSSLESEKWYDRQQKLAKKNQRKEQNALLLNLYNLLMYDVKENIDKYEVIDYSSDEVCNKAKEDIIKVYSKKRIR